MVRFLPFQQIVATKNRSSLNTAHLRFDAGDAFGLGAVPAFNPEGIGNLPVFALTALLACSGAMAAVLAAALRQRDAAGAGAWALLAAGQLALSVQRLVLTRPRTGDDDGRARRICPGHGGTSSALQASLRDEQLATDADLDLTSPVIDL